MFKSTVFRMFVLRSCLLLLFGSSAAASLVQIQSTDQMVPSFTSTLTFNQYNGPSALSGVKVTLELTAEDAFFGFDNDSSIATTVMVNLDVSGTISSTEVLLPTVDPAAAMFSKTVGLGADNGDSRGYDSSPDIDMKSFNTDDFSAISSGTTNTSLGAYQGSGTFDIEVYFDQILGITGNSGVSMSYIPALAEANVTVEYTTTPEPVSIALFGFGGLMISRRRRHSRS